MGQQPTPLGIFIASELTNVGVLYLIYNTPFVRQGGLREGADIKSFGWVDDTCAVPGCLAYNQLSFVTHRAKVLSVGWMILARYLGVWLIIN
jgi:hypothetical protein